MTILSRKERQTSKKPTKQKWYQRTNYLVITLATVVALIPILSIITLYRDTKEWSNSTVTEPLNTLSPEYVLNYPTTDSKQLRELVSETNKYLDKVMVGETPDLTELLSKTQKLLEDNKLTSGQLYDNYIRLQQYQNVLSFVNTAYSKPDSSTLSTLLSTQEQYVMNHQRDGDKKLLEKLYSINNDYSSVYYFYTSILPQYGTIEGNKLVVSKNVTGFAELKEYAEVLNKFKTAQTFVTALTKQESSILNNNQALIDYTYYIEMKEKTVGLLDLYTRVSDIKTYADVLKNGWTVPNHPDADAKVLSIQLKLLYLL